MLYCFIIVPCEKNHILQRPDDPRFACIERDAGVGQQAHPEFFRGTNGDEDPKNRSGRGCQHAQLCGRGDRASPGQDKRRDDDNGAAGTNQSARICPNRFLQTPSRC